MSCSSEKPLDEKKITNADSFFQRFVMRTRLMKKSTSNASSQHTQPQQRPGLLTTLFGNPIQKLRKQGQQQGALERHTSYAVVRTNHFEETNDFEVCDEALLAQNTTHSPAIGNGARSNKFYRPPRIYQQRAVASSMYQEGVAEALKSEVRVLSAPARQHRPTAAPPPLNGQVTRKISAPAGTPSRNVHQTVAKKHSAAANPPAAGKKKHG